LYLWISRFYFVNILKVYREGTLIISLFLRRRCVILWVRNRLFYEPLVRARFYLSLGLAGGRVEPINLPRQAPSDFARLSWRRALLSSRWCLTHFQRRLEFPCHFWKIRRSPHSYRRAILRLVDIINLSRRIINCWSNYFSHNY